ncbi:protein TEX261 isoform X1 [Athalia rosae]|uniref:protein TEX261 isoform X1 n=1 Tax=Athalia rosae TaxID=37344 RepID=UPI0020346039|nr:protein TEX261 isoform X1 [Athalia rosae]
MSFDDGSVIITARCKNAKKISYEDLYSHTSPKMWFFYVLSWFSLFVQICFATISIAAGLYYLAELVEEYTVLSKRIIRGFILMTLAIQVGFLLFENLPLTMVISGIMAQVAHLCILKTFPYVYITSPSFIISVLMLVVNHYLAFTYFASVYHSFSEVMAYFTLCLWLVPFTLFVSLAANENVLPTVAESRPLLGFIFSDDNDVVSNYFSRRGKKYGLLSFFNYAKESILPQRTKKAF